MTTFQHPKFREAYAFLNRTLQKTRYSAINQRGLDFDLTINDVMRKLQEQDYKCALTGWDLEFTRGGTYDGKNPRGCTIDRIYNRSGYHRWNIQLVCCMPNLVRGKLDLSQFKELCQAVATNCSAEDKVNTDEQVEEPTPYQMLFEPA